MKERGSIDVNLIKEVAQVSTPKEPAANDRTEPLTPPKVHLTRDE